MFFLRCCRHQSFQNVLRLRLIDVPLDAKWQCDKGLNVERIGPKGSAFNTYS